jgi:hypothetical protein
LKKSALSFTFFAFNTPEELRGLANSGPKIPLKLQQMLVGCHQVISLTEKGAVEKLVVVGVFHD